MKAKQAVVVAFLVGVVLAFPVGCGTPTPSCNAANCTGCCSTKGACVGGAANTECGKGGLTCTSCTGGTPSCLAGICKAGAGGGSGGGTGGGSGGGTGGGAGGGTAGGAGGGTAGGAGGGTAGGAGGGVALNCGASALANHLLFSEIRTQPSGGEAIEIYNPTGASVDLSDYRIYNATFISADGLSDCRYYNRNPLPDGGTCGAAFTDFDIQFPAGATIASNATKVIALTGANWFCDAGNCGGGLPDFEIAPNDGGANAAIPDMRGVWDPNAGNGYLTNQSEDLIFYKWNGVVGTNVQDVDYFIYGAGIRTDKTGVGTYLADTAVTAQSVMDGGTAATTSYLRACYNEQNETKTSGNGVTGHNETSEPHNANWVVGAPNFGAKTPGSVP